MAVRPQQRVKMPPARRHRNPRPGHPPAASNPEGEPPPVPGGPTIRIRNVTELSVDFKAYRGFVSSPPSRQGAYPRARHTSPANCLARHRFARVGTRDFSEDTIGSFLLLRGGSGRARRSWLTQQVSIVRVNGGVKAKIELFGL